MGNIPAAREDELRRLIDDLEHSGLAPGLAPAIAGRFRQELEERRQAEQALRDSEARLRAIVTTAVEGIITIDERGIIESVNPAIERIFGYGADELVGRNVTVLMPSPHAQRHDQHIADYLRTGRARIIGIGREVTGQKKDGTVFPIDLAVSEVHLAGRRFFTGIVRDVTERKRVEDELRRAKEAAEAANKAKDNFLAMLSHELRTPLTPVLAAVTLVQQRQDLPPDLREQIGAIRRNVEMEARLIDDLLDLTRVSRGKIELHLETVDAHALFRNALEVCQKDLEEKSIEVALTLRARRRHVRADPARLQQVFWNLIKNAVKFTPQGGTIAIRTHNEQTANDTPERLVVEVSDTGIGIEPDTLPRIFDAFEQGRSAVTRTFGGLGLGLAISRALVEIHKGTILADSPGPGRGSTFTVRLPALALPPRAALPTPPPPGQNAAQLKTMRILLVEDHVDTLRVMASLLRHLGHDVTTAASVREALDAAAAHPFDLLISDVGLPDGSGLDVMRQIKALYGWKGIALSGFGMDDDIRRSAEAGFDQHLTKPVDFQTLESVIRRVAS